MLPRKNREGRACGQVGLLDEKKSLSWAGSISNSLLAKKGTHPPSLAYGSWPPPPITRAQFLFLPGAFRNFGSVPWTWIM